MVHSDRLKHAYLSPMSDPRIRPRRGFAAGGDGVMPQDHRYLDPPILGVQTVCVPSVDIPTLRTHTSHSVQSCVPGPTTTLQRYG